MTIKISSIKDMGHMPPRTAPGGRPTTYKYDPIVAQARNLKPGECFEVAGPELTSLKNAASTIKVYLNRAGLCKQGVGFTKRGMRFFVFRR